MTAPTHTDEQGNTWEECPPPAKVGDGWSTAWEVCIAGPMAKPPTYKYVARKRFAQGTWEERGLVTRELLDTKEVSKLLADMWGASAQQAINELARNG